MSSIIKRPGYSDRFERDQKRFALAFPDAVQFLQSDEMNEVQSMLQDQQRRVSEYILQDGRRVSGADPVVAEIEGDETKVSVRLPASAIYIAGHVHDVQESIFVLDVAGDVSIGVRVSETLENHISDVTLRGQISGTEAFMEPGAARVRMVVSWGHSADLVEAPVIPVYSMRNGAILTNESNIDYSEIYNAISNYSRESNGSFVNSGCMVAGVGLNGDGDQQFTISEGVAYVNGRRIPRAQNMRFNVPEEPNLRSVSAEPHAWTAATGGTQTFTLSKSPIAVVSEVTIVKRVTETVTHGAFSGVTDALLHSSVESIVSVKQGGTTYTSPGSWLLSQGQIDWSPAGAEPSPGSTYQVDYRYYENVMPTAVTRESITVVGAVNPSNILVDYTYKLPRIDVVAMDMSGAVLYLKGVAAISRPQPPVVPSTQLELARINNKWGIAPDVVQSAVRNVPYSEITNMREALLDIYDLIAQERLKSDVSSREVAAKRGVFVDPFLDDDLRDQGIAQTAASFGGFLRLPVAGRVHEFPALTSVQTLAFTDEVVISQLRETGEMKINPYQTFTPMPGRASLEPSIDIWTDKQTVWPSAETATFDPPDRGANGNNNTITSVSLESRIELIRSTNVAAEFVRTRNVNFRLEGFIEAETITSVLFDGVVAVTSGLTSANADGVITGVFTIPANIRQGTKVVAFVGSVGTRARSTYVASGTITVEEYRIATALNGTIEELPRPVTQVTQVINQTTVVNNTINNINQVQNIARGWSEDTGGGGSSSDKDPLAQTFMLTEGRCVTAIRLKCKTKGLSSNSVAVQIRTVEVGLPTSEVLAEAFVPGTALVAGGFFTARFTTPLYLEPGRAYAFVVLTDDANHSLAVAGLGKIDQNNAIVSEQPFVVGVLLSSSNAQTWTVHNDIDLVFQLIGCLFSPAERTVAIGAFTATKMSDIIVSAGVEYPESQASIEITMTRPNGEIITASPEQRIRLDTYIQNETIQVAAKLRGTAKLTPFLFPGVQIIEGEIAATADYVTRSVTADDAERVTVTFDAFLPSGSTVAVSIGVPGSYVAASVLAATPLGDGLVEQTYQRTPYAPLDARTKITLTGTPAARPELSKLRMITTEI
ncbi:DUF4815 domain-containing protein [Mesorhizobium sp. NBSH29]|uniref:DUF4815 domain-containing protein n=1 Tax=Mesorhizobium sp. NBSH29 TaxID=2654249 RepID=UPI0018966D15|nr:DUF4815 domain-containing protein [Mesorhizobium sp. NBSH29]QPC87144.1 DUF4815 domain-containing protein [Mesorhizobium sp. NBSH29]